MHFKMLFNSVSRLVYKHTYAIYAYPVFLTKILISKFAFIYNTATLDNSKRELQNS